MTNSNLHNDAPRKPHQIHTDNLVEYVNKIAQKEQDNKNLTHQAFNITPIKHMENLHGAMQSYMMVTLI